MLLDVILAMTLLSVGVFVVMVFCRNEAREQRSSHERLVAQLAAESELERLRAAPYAAILPGERRPVACALPSVQRLKEARVLLTVSEIEPGLKRATARVEWSSPVGRTQFAEFTGLFSREGQP
jgi:hypothetical protein